MDDEIVRESSQSLPMYLGRPSEVTTMIAAEYTHMQNEGNPVGYLFVGRGHYMLGNFSYSAYIAAVCESLHRDDLDILDIGTGDGQFLIETKKQWPRSHVTGISAHDLSGQDNVNAVEYIIADGERLADPNILPHEKRYDLIVSAETIQHFIDPAGSIEQIYALLKPGGYLILDTFSLPGVNQYLPQIISHLKRQGIPAFCDYQYILDGHTKTLRVRDINSLIIQKPNIPSPPEFRFPLTYDGIEEGVVRYGVATELTPEDTANTLRLPFRLRKTALLFESWINSGIRRFYDMSLVDSNIQSILIPNLKYIPENERGAKERIINDYRKYMERLLDYLGNTPSQMARRVRREVGLQLPIPTKRGSLPK